MQATWQDSRIRSRHHAYSDNSSTWAWYSRYFRNISAMMELSDVATSARDPKFTKNRDHVRHVCPGIYEVFTFWLKSMPRGNNLDNPAKGAQKQFPGKPNDWTREYRLRERLSWPKSTTQGFIRRCESPKRSNFKDSYKNRGILQDSVWTCIRFFPNKFTHVNIRKFRTRM